MSLDHIIKNSKAIISIEARGLIFGSAIFHQVSKPMIDEKKIGKFPGEIF